MVFTRTGCVFLHVVILVLLSCGIVRTDEPYFGTIGEGFTAPNASEGINATFRMFTSQDDICRNVRPAAKLVAYNVPVILRVGEWFPLYNLAVVAVDTLDRPLPPVPITINVEHKDPPVLNLRSDMIAYGEILPIRPGRFRFGVSALCGRAFVEIEAEVVAGAKPSRTKDQNGGR